MKQHLLILFLLMINAINLIAETPVKSQWAAYPFVIYTGETSLTLGGFALNTQRPENQDLSKAPDSFIANSMLSVKKNLLSFIQYEKVLMEGRLIVTPYISYRNWPSDYYGISLNNSEDYLSRFTMESLELRSTVKYELIPKVYGQIGVRYNQTNNYKFEEGSFLAENMSSQLKGSTIAGYSAAIIYDSRNNTYYPTKGIYANYSYSVNSDLKDDDFDYSAHIADVRYYQKINENSVLGFQSKIKITKDQAPFYEQSLLGDELRAYPSNRFIDRDMVVLKTEYRVFPWEYSWKKRIGFVGFVEAGQVAQHISDFDSRKLKYSLGTGLRISIIPDERLNFRFDIAKGSESVQVVFIAQEAF